MARVLPFVASTLREPVSPFKAPAGVAPFVATSPAAAVRPRVTPPVSTTAAIDEAKDALWHAMGKLGELLATCGEV